MHILQWQMTYEPQQERFIKMAVLHCISISEICSAINSTVATLHENFTSQQNSLTAGPRYIRGCCLTLERRYGFRAGAWVDKALFQKGSEWKSWHDRNTISSQKR